MISTGVFLWGAGCLSLIKSKEQMQVLASPFANTLSLQCLLAVAWNVCRSEHKYRIICPSPAECKDVGRDQRSCGAADLLCPRGFMWGHTEELLIAHPK